MALVVCITGILLDSNTSGNAPQQQNSRYANNQSHYNQSQNATLNQTRANQIGSYSPEHNNASHQNYANISYNQQPQRMFDTHHQSSPRHVAPYQSDYTGYNENTLRNRSPESSGGHIPYAPYGEEINVGQTHNVRDSAGKD